MDGEQATNKAGTADHSRTTQKWWEKEGLSAPCPNWRVGARRCNCKQCRVRRKAVRLLDELEASIRKRKGLLS
jgi:hypothetical protein